MRLADNPVYTRLTRHARWLSLRVTFWLALAMGLAMLVWHGRTVSGLIQERTRDGLYGFGSLAGMSDYVLLMLPAISGWIGAVVTTRDVRSDEFLLQRISPLPAFVAVRGYFLATLFSIRLLLAALAGWIPALVVAGFAAAISGRMLQPPPPSILAQVTEALITGGLAQLLIGVGLFGAIALGAALGVWMGLLWRHTTPAVASAMLPGTIAPLAAAVLLQPWYWYYMPLTNPLDFTILILNATWLLIPAVLWLAARAYDRGRVS